MEMPSLKLVMLRGPREGETLEFPPGSTVRIGRVVRGNNLPIKDPGISSKHILIGSESDTWTVMDLDSSNGTILNSSNLTPFTTSDLCHGDTLKLGEYTSIEVQFVHTTSQLHLRRNPRRNANSSRKMKKSEKEDEQLEIVEASDVAVENRRRGRPPRRGKVSDQVKEAETLGGLLVERVTRGRKKKLQELPTEIEVSEKLQELPPESVKENMELELNSPEEVGEKEVRVEKEELEVGESKEADRKGEACGSGNLGGGKGEIDLEKMTLGEWFDYMEERLRKEIFEETEKVIEEMRKNAERVKEYLAQKKKERCVANAG